MTEGPLAGHSRFSSRRATFGVGFVVAAIVIVVDQLTKTWAVNALADGRRIRLIWTLQFNLTYNSGMAFSKGTGFGPLIGALAVIVVIGLVVSLRRVSNTMTLLATGLIIGGALGNIIDRLLRGDAWFHGSVIDFIDLQWWPVFNVADMCVMTGAAMMIFGVSRSPGHGKAASLS
ncbi:MAG: signal peptidase II [Ilumatobacteraceae bacterium]